MAKTYTSTIQIRCWKHHQCVGCEGSYAYEFVRKITGTGGTEEKASKAANANAEKAIASDTDLHPCPTCGLFQPDMIGQRRAQRAWLVFWCALVAFGVSLILASAYTVQIDTLTWVVAGIGAFAAAALWKINVWNPNSNVSSNVTRAAGNVAAGKLLHQPGDASRPVKHLATPAKSAFHKVTLLLVLAAVILAAMPEVVRASRGWPINSTAYPPVAGPGDHVRIYMDGKIESIKSYWRGKADARIREGTHTYPATTSTNQKDWGTTIHAKSSEKSSSSTPWVGVTLPNEAGLAGKAVNCDIQLNVQFPQMQGSGTFTTASKSMQRTVGLNLAPVGAGTSYTSLWWQYTLAGMALLLVCSIFLVRIARALQRQAPPTKIFTADGGASK